MDNIRFTIRANSQQARTSINSLNNSMNTLSRNAKTSETRFARLFSSIRKGNNSFTNLSKDADRASVSIGKLTGGLKNYLKTNLVGIVSQVGLGMAIGQCIQSASDMTETVNLFSVSMGDLAEETQTTVEHLSELSGLDQTNMQNAIGNYTLLARSMGLTSKNAQTLGTNTYKLALDLASLTNVPVNQALQDLRSGLVGQSETVYKYGIDVTEASLKTEALALGITKSVRNMSQGEKMALRYSVMLKQTKLAQGDMAKTINECQNQWRVLSERVVTMSRALGSIFIPAVSAVLPYLNALVSMLTKLFRLIASAVGFKMPEVKNVENSFSGIEDGAEDATDAVNGTAKAIKDMYSLGMDELNVIDPNKGSSGGGSGAIAGDFDLDLAGYDNLMDNVKMKSSEIEAEMQKIVDKIVEASKPLTEIDFEPLSNSIDHLWSGLKKLTELTFDGLMVAYETLFVPFSVWAMETLLPTVIENLATALDTLNTVIEICQPALKAFFDTVLVPLGKFVADSFINTIKLMTEGLKKLGDWCKENPETIQKLAEHLGLLALTFAGIELVSKMSMISKILTITVFILGNLDKIKPILEKLPLDKLEELKNKFTGVKDKVSESLPTFEEVKTTVETVCTNIKTYYDTYIKPIIEQIVPLIFNVVDSISKFWENILKPILERVGISLVNLWNNIKPIIDRVLELSAVILEFYNKVLKPLFDWTGDLFAPILVNSWNTIGDTVDLVITNISNIIQGLIETLTGIIMFLTGVFTGDWDKAWEGIKKTFKGIFKIMGIDVDDIKMKFNNWCDSVKENAEESWDSLEKNWEGAKTWFATKVTTPLKETFEEKWDDIKDKVSNTKDELETKWENSKTWFEENVTNPVGEKFNTVWEAIKTEGENSKGNIETAWNNVSTWFTTNVTEPVKKIFTGCWDTIKVKFEDAWNGMGNFLSGMKTTFDNIMSNILDVFKAPLNTIIGWINKVIDAWNSLSFEIPKVTLFEQTFGGFSVGVPKISKVPQLAKGGMLEAGQIFSAGEFGKAELIGNYNNKTTVMPLEDSGFVSAMYNAVYEAMTQANESGSTIENVLYLDGEVVYQNQQKIKKNRGYDLGLGAFA